jgi:hypothetical protein
MTIARHFDLSAITCPDTSLESSVKTILYTMFPNAIVKFTDWNREIEVSRIPPATFEIIGYKEDHLRTVVAFLQARTPQEDREDRPTEEEEEELVEDDSPHACGICWTRKRKYRVSCGHVYCGACSKHATSTGNCPTCRQRVHMTRQRVYL